MSTGNFHICHFRAVKKQSSNWIVNWNVLAILILTKKDDQIQKKILNYRLKSELNCNTPTASIQFQFGFFPIENHIPSRFEWCTSLFSVSFSTEARGNITEMVKMINTTLYHECSYFACWMVRAKCILGNAIINYEAFISKDWRKHFMVFCYSTPG